MGVCREGRKRKKEQGGVWSGRVHPSVVKHLPRIHQRGAGIWFNATRYIKIPAWNPLVRVYSVA